MNAVFTLPDGSTVKKPYGTTPADIAESIGPALARDAVAARVDGTLMDLDVSLEQDAEIEIITSDSAEGLEILRHSTAHVMACAVNRLYSDVRFGIGPAIEDGFYYDFDLSESISADHLERIEEEMGRIRSEELVFEREEVPVHEARRMMEESGQSYKLELLDDMELETVSLYRTGDFVDLCRGPHLPHTGKTPPFTLLNVAGAYWKGSEANPQLQRIYGTAFATEEELEEYMERRREAAKRDHREIGQQLDLFSTDEEIGQGFILWHPRGARIRETIERYWKDLHTRKGYSLIATPHVANEEVYRRSGHIPKYEEMMYAPLEIEGERYRVKPMNCPGHIKIFKSDLRSYRDLPIRYAELGTVYRHELSGALHGMLRVRGFTQDDAHIFCTPEQLPGEIESILQMIEQMMDAFGFDYHPSLATRPEVSLETASDEQWEQATDSLRQALEARGLDYDVDEGEGTFYAPKIDVKLYDALGREWQGPTIQVDLNLPKRFDVSYIGDDNEEHECVIVHRAILGSLERFVGMLIEHFAGWFPVWLAPEQVRVLPITDDHMEYARKVRDRLREAGLRATCDERNEKTGYKVHSGTDDKVPYLLIVGDREVEEGTVSVRSHDDGDEGAVSLETFVNRITSEVEDKQLPADM
mgnify:CR=1 FL=1